MKNYEKVFGKGVLKQSMLGLDYYEVPRPIHAFKKTYLNGALQEDDVIVNLIIPVGAIVCVSEFKHTSKFRASKAFVYSQALVRDGSSVTESASWWDPDFIYCSGDMVEPHQFSDGTHLCSGGIHFFLNLDRAILY